MKRYEHFQRVREAHKLKRRARKEERRKRKAEEGPEEHSGMSLKDDLNIQKLKFSFGMDFQLGGS